MTTQQRGRWARDQRAKRPAPLTGAVAARNDGPRHGRVAHDPAAFARNVAICRADCDEFIADPQAPTERICGAIETCVSLNRAKLTAQAQRLGRCPRGKFKPASRLV